MSLETVLTMSRRIPSRPEGGWPLVSVIIPSHNHAHYLGEAIDSVLAQRYPSMEVLVVDDGSTDDTASVVTRYPAVQYLAQSNQGLAAARNRGMSASRGEYLVFLDADDRLLPRALAAGLECFSRWPRCAFVSGRYVRITGAGEPKISQYRSHPARDHYLALLRRNYVGMHATVMYRRTPIVDSGGFDVTLAACEDYDIYLRIAREHPVATHEEPVAEYRIHGTNMSRDYALMLAMALKVLDRQRPYVRGNREREEAWRQGRRFWRALYVEPLLWQVVGTRTPRTVGKAARGFLVLGRHAPLTVAKAPARILFRLLRKSARVVLPRRIQQFIRKGSPGTHSSRVGGVRFGDLRRLTPIGGTGRQDRGLPIDRHYIEVFLGQHTQEIRGRVLEVGGEEYTRRLGGPRVTRSDVLRVVQRGEGAKLAEELAGGEVLPSDGFDCVILVQALHLVEDVRLALRTVHRVLKAGGTLLMTVPGTMSRLDPGQESNAVHWGFTGLAVRESSWRRCSSRRTWWFGVTGTCCRRSRYWREWLLVNCGIMNSRMKIHNTRCSSRSWRASPASAPPAARLPRS
jgi:glycosyltransferase involved in cell wall biosynthesis